MQDLKDLGKRINAIKTEFGYSNQELGAICGVSYTAIGNIIHGITKDPSVSLFIKLTTKLDISLDWLLFGKGEMLKSDNSSKRDHPETVKFLKQEITNLKTIINIRESELETLKKMIGLLENQTKPHQAKKKAS